MNKFQLWSRDEYGQGSIHASSESLDELIKQGETLINSANVDNALTVDDKKRNWESFMVHLSGGDNPVELYGGKSTIGKDVIYSIDEKNKVDSYNLEDSKSNLKIYLGKLDNEDWYATDERGNEVDSLQHRSLQGKTIYFIRLIK
jgi:hypothetical protein